VTPRFFCAAPLGANRSLTLPAGAARHVQVLRMQPGDTLTLFDGAGGEYTATVERMGRSDVDVAVGSRLDIEREPPHRVHLAVGMPANERMDWLVEKATELGVASIQPLMTAHGVLKLTGERAEKKRVHWASITVAACEQCGRNRVPLVHPVQAFADWIESLSGNGQRFVLSLTEDRRTVHEVLGDASQGLPLDTLVLSGPEGGLSALEERQALGRGFIPLTLGPRVLRAETAALAALVHLASRRD